jgi:sterol desaturase/sphingolipid hydroxylase (fatty acid hydroxylase superfamily)
MYIHSNLNVKTGKLQRIINGPEMHRWHHSTGKGETEILQQNWQFGIGYLIRPIYLKPNPMNTA